MDNPRIIHAPINSRGFATTSPITQYDYGYLLLPEGVELPTIYEIDFSNDEKKGTSLTVYGDSNGAEVPEELIRTGKDVYAFYYRVGEGYGKTEFTWRLPNKCRPSRDGEVPTPSQQSSIDQLITRSNEAVERAEDAQQAIEDMSVSATTLAEGSSATVTKTESEGVVHLTFGIPKGQTGETPNITASKTGDTTYIYADSVEIARIKDGINGDDGYSPTASVSKSGKVATITITDQNGTTSAQVEDGTDGQDGISPTVTITPITGGHRITITDADGTETADVMDGTTPDLTDYVRFIDLATTSRAGAMSAQDKGRLDSVYEDYSSALTALGVI